MKVDASTRRKLSEIGELLRTARERAQVSQAVLAEKIGMDRTTLTRNLRPLTKAKWVAAASGKDRRQHLLQVTAAGKRKLVRSRPLWEEAQRQLLSQIGFQSMQELRTLLASTETAVTKASAVAGNGEHEK